MSDFQSLAGEQGKQYHNDVIKMLRYNGFEIQEEEHIVEDVGVKIDTLAMNKHGLSIPFEFKGAFRGKRPGLVRDDSALKAIAEGYLLRESEVAPYWIPMVVVTSHLPRSGSASYAKINAVPRSVILGFVSDRDVDFFRWLASANEDAIRDRIEFGVTIHRQPKHSAGINGNGTQLQFSLPGDVVLSLPRKCATNVLELVMGQVGRENLTDKVRLEFELEAQKALGSNGKT